MLKRQIGGTGIDVSFLGLGTVKFGRNQGVKYPETFQLPTDAEILNLLSSAKELGINFLDTAPAYGASEERLGKLLKGTRSDWVISTKVGESFINGGSLFDFSPAAIKVSVDRSLNYLQTDYLDMVLVHSNGDDEKIILDDEAFVTLDALKRAGKIRAYGMSSKTIEGGKLTIAHADVAMVTFNLSYQEEREIIHYAHEMKKGVLIKKAFASGHLHTLSADPVQDTMRLMVSEAGISSVIVGTLNLKHLRDNVLVLEQVLEQVLKGCV